MSGGQFLYYIDWGGAGLYTSAGSDVSQLIDGPAGITFSRGKDQIRQFAPPAAGQFVARLFNQSRDYSPGNTTGPLYGQLVPGHRVRVIFDAGAGTGGGGTNIPLFLEDGTTLLLEDGTDFLLESSTGGGIPGGTRTVWVGLLDDLIQHPEREGDARLSVDIPSLGMLSKLRGKIVSTALYQNITTSDALGYLLDAAGWPAGERSIQTGLTTMSWWWLDDADAFSAVEELRATEGPASSVYEDGNGYIVFENRDSRTTLARSTASQATFTDALDIVTLQHNLNFKDVIEAATLTIQEREPAGQAVIWQYGSAPLVLASNEVKPLQVRSGGDPFMGAIIPSAAPSDTVQTLTASATLTAGTYKPKFRDVVAAAAINWNSTAAQWQTSLESISTIGAGNVVCNGGPINTMPVSVSFVGIFAGLDITDLIEIVESTLNPVSAPATIEVTEEHAGDGILAERQALRPSTPLVSGAYVIDMPVEHPFSTSSLAYNAAAGTVQTAIRASGSWGSVVVTGGPLSSGIPFQINMIYSANLSMATISSSTVMGSVPTATITAIVTTQGGVPDYVLTAGAVTFSLDRTSGAYVTLTLTAGSGGATLTGLQMRANPVPVVRTYQVTYPEGTTVPTGQIFKPPSVRAEIPRVDAESYLQMLVLHYELPRLTTVFEIINSMYDVTNDLIFQREISDMITIVDAQTGVNATFHIEQIQHSIENLTLVTRLGCEKTNPAFP